ncbi:hypothetical protein FB45DRAFT_917966 [Roridomyces roridus]|uniref:Fork-head domain-containing protein n=1 Tax=Roridomyces roridus TaxID=1738132 RepID=A0AAD7BWD1_9AGAR|nr:hypothetical protein FB45DRAFT_917966 [Roridomyces roridus]
MASLQNILNPERKRSVKLLVIPPAATWDPPPQPSPGSSSEDEIDDYNLHISHPDCPDSLACLPDTDGRPQHTLPVILRCAILGAPRKRLTIREIYAAMEEKYAYYRSAGQTWKQSVRHHLSLNRLFERQPRPATDPGFGSYWTTGQSAKKDASAPAPAPVLVEEPASVTALKPRLGRPRKDDSAMPYADMHMYEEREDVDDRRSGRRSLPSLTPYDSSGGYHVSPEPHPQSMDTDDIVERLQMEMAGLRRQSAEAHSTSLHLTDQLARSRAETSNAQAALAALEIKLRDETNKRRQAERAAEEAIQLRLAAEEALNSYRYHSDPARNPPRA